MITKDIKSLGELASLLKKDIKDLEKKTRGAARRAAVKGRAHVKRNIPVAHGELRESVHTEDAKIVVDAPHAAAVNNGSRPHWVPLGPLIEWVKLRGMQGLGTDRQVGRLPGSSTASAARGVAGMLRSLEHRGPAGYADVDAAEQVARAIQRAIAARGTKPHHFIEKSLPELRRLVESELKTALRGPAAEGASSPTASKSKAPDTRRRDSRGRFVKH